MSHPRKLRCDTGMKLERDDFDPIISHSFTRRHSTEKHVLRRRKYSNASFANVGKNWAPLGEATTRNQDLSEVLDIEKCMCIPKVLAKTILGKFRTVCLHEDLGIRSRP
jgi:hypothetical protein